MPISLNVYTVIVKPSDIISHDYNDIDLVILNLPIIVVTLTDIMYTGFMYNETKEADHCKLRFSAVKNLHAFKEV